MLNDGGTSCDQAKSERKNQRCLGAHRGQSEVTNGDMLKHLLGIAEELLDVVQEVEPTVAKVVLKRHLRDSRGSAPRRNEKLGRAAHLDVLGGDGPLDNLLVQHQLLLVARFVAEVSGEVTNDGGVLALQRIEGVDVAAVKSESESARSLNQFEGETRSHVSMGS